MHSCGCVLQILTSLSSASGGLVAMRRRINSQTSSGFLLVFSHMQSNCKLTLKNCVSWLVMWLLCWWVLFQPLIMNSDEVWKLSQWTSDNVQLLWLKSSKIIFSYFDWCPPTPNSDSSNLPWSGLEAGGVAGVLVNTIQAVYNFEVQLGRFNPAWRGQGDWRSRGNMGRGVGGIQSRRDGCF